MEFMNVVQARKSVRSFLDKPVEQEKLDKVLEAARWAPSWANKQCTQYIVVTDENKIAQLAGEFRSWLKQAPVVLVACADPKCSGSHDDMDYYLVDVGISMQQLVLATTNEGLGTCWIGAFTESQVKDVLGVPDNIKVVAYTPLGYPSGKIEAFEQRIKTAVGATTRKPIDAFVHREKW